MRTAVMLMMTVAATIPMTKMQVMGGWRRCGGMCPC